MTGMPDRIGDAGRRAEARTFKRVQASGAWGGAKGDMGSEDFLLESKSTVNSSYRLVLDVLRKAEREALATGRRPALAVQFVDGTGRPKRGGAWVMVRESDFAGMTAPEGG